MPLRLEIKKKLSSRSDRVKSVDLHPTEPWVLSALYNGNVFIWDWETTTLVKSFEVCTLPVRCAKFITRKQWFITASDDMQMRIFNYNTMEKVHSWEAHTDYIRYLEVHPSLPYVLSCSDDMSIKLWDWDKGWDCTQVFEGHAHYVMMVKFNTKDSNTFASASLDRSVKVWGLGAPTPHFSLDGHDRGVNCVDYYPGGDRPYLLSGADDKLVKIWDYQTKSCVQTLDGHANNVSAVLFHPRLPVILSGSEDGTVRIWHATTYRAETTLNYGMERVWALAAGNDSKKVAIGFDEGTIVLKLGHEMPVASLDTHTGKVVWAQNAEIQTATLKGLAAECEAGDGERLPVAPKDLGSTELFPQSIRHNCNGRFLVVCGDGEFIIYTSQALRNKSFGSALDFAWSSVGTGDYATRVSISQIKTFKNFKEAHTLRPPVSSCEGLSGGACLAVIGADSVVFFDWDEGIMVRKIEVVPKEVYWSEAGDLCLLACEESYYVLKYDASIVQTAIQSGQVNAEEGVESAFELLHEIQGRVRTGQWVGDCFLYTTGQGRLNYYVGGEVMTLCHLDHPMYMLGYLPKEDRVFLVDKQQNIFSYRVRQAMLQYQTAVVRKDFEAANALLPSIPKSEYTNVARFLESQGFKAEALQVSQDPDHKFDLALELGLLEMARQLLDAMPPEEYDTTDAQTKWKRLGDLALKECDLSLVAKCAENSSDLGGLLLLHASTGDRDGMAALAARARELGRTNVAFTALLLLGHVEECVALLVDTGRVPEAAFMARTYLPSDVSRLVALWKKDLATVSQKASDALADPAAYPNLFADLEVALRVEELFRTQRDVVIPASAWPTAKGDLDLDLIAMVKAQATAPVASPPPPPPPADAAAAGESLRQAPPTPAAAVQNCGDGFGGGEAEAEEEEDDLDLEGDDDDDEGHGGDGGLDEAAAAEAAAAVDDAMEDDKDGDADAAAAEAKAAAAVMAAAAAAEAAAAAARAKAEGEAKAQAASAAAAALEKQAKVKADAEAKAAVAAAAEHVQREKDEAAARAAAEAEAKRRSEAVRKRAEEEAGRRAEEARRAAEAAAAAATVSDGDEGEGDDDGEDLEDDW